MYNQKCEKVNHYAVRDTEKVNGRKYRCCYGRIDCRNDEPLEECKCCYMFINNVQEKMDDERNGMNRES